MKCVETYDGKEFWVSDEQAQKLDEILDLANPPRRIDIEGVKIAVNSISGVFDELTMKEKEYRKQGMWICDCGRWHAFKDTCNCKQNFMKYGHFEYESACPKSKKLLDFEAKNGPLELNFEAYTLGTTSSAEDILKTIKNS